MSLLLGDSCNVTVTLTVPLFILGSKCVNDGIVIIAKRG